MLRALPFRRQHQQFYRAFSSAMASQSTTPMEDTIREKIQTNLSPLTLTIRNDSHLHAHHEPMRNVTSCETHFNVTIISADFEGKTQPARHRMVYGLFKDEMARENGIHALQLKTRTVQEEEKRRKQREGEESAGADGGS